MSLVDLELPNIRSDLFHTPDLTQLTDAAPVSHVPRFLLLYGSLRERSYSKLLTMEAARRINSMGRRHGLVLTGTARCDDGNYEGAD